jgi:hypothetical protein
MTHEAMHGATRKIDGALLSQQVEAPEISPKKHERSVLREKTGFLGVVATDLVVAAAVSPDPKAHLRVAEHYIENVEIMLPDLSQARRDRLAVRLVRAAHRPAQARMAKDWRAAEAKNELVGQNLQAALKTLETEVPPDVYSKFKQQLYSAVPPISESPLPSTAELNASIENLTDETVSPPRGLAIDLARKAGLAAIVLVTRKLHR